MSVFEEIKRGLESQVEGPKQFNCKKCGELFTPAEGQWIFYDLCDDCFDEYNSVKMQRRLSSMRELYLEEFLENRGNG